MATRTVELATRDSHQFAALYIRFVRRDRFLGASLLTLGGFRRHLVFAPIEIRVNTLRPAFSHFSPLISPIARHFSTHPLYSTPSPGTVPLRTDRLAFANCPALSSPSTAVFPPSPGTFPPVTRRALAHRPQWFARRTAFDCF